RPVRRRQHRSAIGVGSTGTVKKIVLVERLPKCEIAQTVATGVADDTRWPLLGDIGRYHPGLHAVFTRLGDIAMQLAAGLHGALYPAIVDAHTPVAHPFHITDQVEG